MPDSAEVQTPAKLRRLGWSDAAAFAAAAFALALQFQLTVPLGDTPLRIAASDILLALLAPFFLIFLWRTRRALAQARFPLWAAFLAAATAALTWGLAIGIWKAGGLDGWAAKKYVGWFLLLGYGLYGLVFAFCAPRKAPAAFVRCFLLLLMLIVSAYVILAGAGCPWSVTGSMYGARLSGFAVNPNAFAVILLSGVALALTRERGGLVAGILAAGILFTQSISALIAMAVIGGLFLLLRRQWVVLLQATLVAGIVYVAPAAVVSGVNMMMRSPVVSAPKNDVGKKIDAFLSTGQGESGRLYEISVPPRIETIEQGLALWKKEPVFGIGLGSFWLWRVERATRTYEPLSIHSTPVWILAELGVFGLIVFAGLFASMALALFRTAATPSALPLSGLLLLVGWGVISLSADFVYQRTPWFVLGLCLGLALLSDAPRPRDAAPLSKLRRDEPAQRSAA